MERFKEQVQNSSFACIPPLYDITPSLLKLCFLNARSLHRHIEEVSRDLNYLSAHGNIFAGTRFSSQDNNGFYSMGGYYLFRNDNPISGKDLMEVQLCIVESSTYLDIPTVTTYIALRLL